MLSLRDESALVTCSFSSMKRAVDIVIVDIADC